MKEEMFFLEYCQDGVKKDIFLHCYWPAATPSNVYLFVNPAFDEKRRVQLFQGLAARALCEAGNAVVRFDYYGTGDSGGELYQFELTNALRELAFVHQYAAERCAARRVILLGIRFGADLAMAYAGGNPQVKDLILVEPVLNGPRYLRDLDFRRGVLVLKYKMQVKRQITINGREYIDHQGYPISPDNVAYLRDWNPERICLTGRNVHLLKLANSDSAEAIALFKNRIAAENRVSFRQVASADFWIWGVRGDSRAVAEAVREIAAEET